MKPNTGRLLREAIGKRVIVKLRSGSVCGQEPVGNALPNGWAADGKQGCRWSLTGAPHDILEYTVIE